MTQGRHGHPSALNVTAPARGGAGSGRVDRQWRGAVRFRETGCKPRLTSVIGGVSRDRAGKTQTPSLTGRQVFDGDRQALGGHQTDMRAPSWPMPPPDSASTVAGPSV